MNRRPNTYIVGKHQYALYFWVKCFEKGIIGRNAILVHIDLHSDFIDPRVEITNLNSMSVLKSISQSKIRHHSFIVPAIDNGIIGEILFCCNEKQKNSYGKFDNLEYPNKVVENLCVRDFERKDIILDIDIDYFLRFQNDCIYLKPMADEEIYRHLDSISVLFEMASITTVATSPEIFVMQPDWRKAILSKVMRTLEYDC